MEGPKRMCATDLMNLVRGELRIPGTEDQLKTRIATRLRPLVGDDDVEVQIGYTNKTVGAVLKIGRSAMVVDV